MKSGQLRYAGFWPRVCAGAIDVLVLLPFFILWTWSFFTSYAAALFVIVLAPLLVEGYYIYFVGRWGQTIGKMALKIKVVSLDGSDAGMVRAFYRDSVNIILSIVATTITLTAVLSIPSDLYSWLPSFQKMQFIQARINTLSQTVVDSLYWIWAISEFIVLMTNKKKRAIHDFIAGTVVVHVDNEKELVIAE